MCTQIILIDIDDSKSFNTDNLFENLENIYSDGDDSYTDPDYVPFQTLEVSCADQDSYEGKQILIVYINLFSTNYRVLHLQNLLSHQIL